MNHPPHQQHERRQFMNPQEVQELNQELWNATCDDDCERITAALRRGANVNHHCRSRRFSSRRSYLVGWTPIFMASSQGFLEAVLVLLKHGASVVANTALTNNDDVETLGTNATAATRKTTTTPLHLACQNGHFHIAKILLQEARRQHGGDGDGAINAVDSIGRTPLCLACCRGQYEIAKWLICAEGAHVSNTSTTTNNHHRVETATTNPLYSAALWGQEDLVRLLLSAGCANILSAANVTTTSDMATKFQNTVRLVRICYEYQQVQEQQQKEAQDYSQHGNDCDYHHFSRNEQERTKTIEQQQRVRRQFNEAWALLYCRDWDPKERFSCSWPKVFVHTYIPDSASFAANRNSRSSNKKMSLFQFVCNHQGMEKTMVALIYMGADLEPLRFCPCRLDDDKDDNGNPVGVMTNCKNGRNTTDPPIPHWHVALLAPLFNPFGGERLQLRQRQHQRQGKNASNKMEDGCKNLSKLWTSLEAHQ